jgi:signal transduction histidine kinase
MRLPRDPRQRRYVKCLTVLASVDRPELTRGGKMTVHLRTAHHDAVGTARSRGSGLRGKVLFHERGSGVELTASRRSTPPAFDHETLMAEVTGHLSATLDYATALAELTRIVAERLGCGCVIDVFEAGGTVQLADVPPRIRAAAGAALEPLVAEVVARGDAVISVKNAAAAGSRVTPAAERARRKLGATWLVSAPLGAPPRIPLGTLTIFGNAAHDAHVSTDLVRELARHMASAIENGRLYRAALAAAREREQILALVAHELKNPLGVILMSTARARMGAGVQRCTCCQHELDVIFRSASRMKKLVSDLLDLASIDAGRLAMKPTSCAPASLVRAAIRDVSSAATAAGIAIVEDLEANLPLAWVDGDRISQVLVNLLTNATKFTPRGGRVRVRAARVDGEVVIAIEDCGSGIAPGDLERVFDRFWQASDTAKLGTGLGLGICKSIIDLSGGRIWAQSTVGVGTTFYFSIPAAA